MEQQKQIQIQFRLVDVQELQFVNLSKKWPEGELQVNNQLQFNCDTEKRIVRCVTNFEYKKNDITQLIAKQRADARKIREAQMNSYRGCR